MQQSTGCPKKNARLCLKACILGWEAPNRPSRGSFELLWFSAFTWTQNVMDSVKASLRKLHLKRANLTQKTAENTAIR